MRLLPTKTFSDYVYYLELIYEWFAFLESGMPIPNFNYFRLAKEAKKASCRLGIRVSDKINNINTPIKGVKWSQFGFTRTMLHTAFDELANDVCKYGQVRSNTTKTFEKKVMDLRQPVLQRGDVQKSEFYSKCTTISGDDLSLTKVIENNMYVYLFISGKCFFNI